MHYLFIHASTILIELMSLRQVSKLRSLFAAESIMVTLDERDLRDMEDEDETIDLDDSDELCVKEERLDSQV